MNYKDLTFPIGFSNGEIGVSQGTLNAFDKCDYALLYKVNRLTKAGIEENFFYGECIHEMLDYFYKNASKPPEEIEIDEQLNTFLKTKNLDWCKPQKLEFYITLVTTVLFAYFNYYEDDFNLNFVELEKVFNIPLPFGIRGTGKKDGIIKDFVFEKKKYLLLLEHKTKTTIFEDYILQSLKIDFQCLFYCYADMIENKRYVDGVLYNVIRKPQSKQKYNEDLKTYSKRLSNEILINPEHYFKRYVQLYNKKDYKEFEHDLKLKLKDFSNLITGKREPRKNNSSCFNGFPCEYIETCSNKNCDKLKQRAPMKRSVINGKENFKKTKRKIKSKRKK